MQQAKVYLPARLQLAEQQMITMVFKQYWYQEDILTLTELIFEVLTGVTSVNHVLGADREDIHFCWRESYYILYFEANSQSCWIETEIADQAPLLADMFALLLPALSESQPEG